MAKILLVDDEPRIARVVRDMVEGADWQFAYADNGADALDAVARETPDLIIMDVMMPKMDGFTACRESRRNCPSVICPVGLVEVSVRQQPAVQHDLVDEQLDAPVFSGRFLSGSYRQYNSAGF